jgi:hypothetical protein
MANAVVFFTRVDTTAGGMAGCRETECFGGPSSNFDRLGHKWLLCPVLTQINAMGRRRPHPLKKFPIPNLS